MEVNEVNTEANATSLQVRSVTDMNRPRIRVLVVDDFRAFRDWVRIKIEKADFEVVGEAADGLEAVQKALQLVPDLILLDIHLPDVSGIELELRLYRVLPSAKVIFLSACSDQDVVHYALSNGAKGYILKSDAEQELLPALDAALRNDKFVSSRCYGAADAVSC